MIARMDSYAVTLVVEASIIYASRWDGGVGGGHVCQLVVIVILTVIVMTTTATIPRRWPGGMYACLRDASMTLTARGMTVALGMMQHMIQLLWLAWIDVYVRAKPALP